MNPIERRAAIGLALIYATRMLGLFMILPVLAIYAEQLLHVTPFLVGLAIGIYGLTQAALQIPFGAWSDRIGRKPVIIAGLGLFMLGSVVAALSESIYGVILGRAVQGMGAIAAVIMALAADLSRATQRTKVMAVIGASIGMSFMLALVLGPLLQVWLGAPGIFWLTAILAGLGVPVVVFLIPAPASRCIHNAEVNLNRFKSVLGNKQLLRLDAGVFILHMALTAVFVVVPLMLRDQFLLAPARHWQIYLAVLAASLLLLAPTILFSERFKQTKRVFQISILLCAVALLAMAWVSDSLILFLIMMVVFFWGFNFLEASLPALVSKVSHAGNKGMSMGVFSSSQFLGAFAGGAGAGLLLENFQQNSVFLFAVAMFFIWFAVALSMQAPEQRHTGYTARLTGLHGAQAQQCASLLRALPGVFEATVIAEENVAYLKINAQLFKEESIQQVCAKLTTIEIKEDKTWREE